MANLADLDIAISVPCRHCDGLLYGRVKFCPYCGAEEEQSVMFGAEGASATLEPEMPIAAAPAFMPQHEVQEKKGKGISVFLDAFNQGKEKAGSEIACYVPPAFEWQKELPAMVTVASPAPHRGAILQRLGVGAALALFVLALVLGAFYSMKPNETDRSRDFAAKLAQAQSALSRSDLPAAERALVVLVAAYPDHPGVRELRDEFDQRVREQLAKREQLREAAMKAAHALGLGDPTPPAPATAPAEAPVVVAPAAPETECSETLAALALCPQGETPKGGR
jgi:hypothetical protein